MEDIRWYGNVVEFTREYLQRIGVHILDGEDDGWTRRTAEVVADADAEREDLTHLQSWAIDGADTRDVDDSVSWDSKKRMVWVHIADPTRYFPRGRQDPMLLRVIHRASTAYLPTGRVDMFPAELMEERLSLDGRKHDGAAMSFGFRIVENDDEGQERGSLTEGTVVMSRIKAPIRLTYDEASKLIDEAKGNSMCDHPLAVLWKLASVRRAYREKYGAQIFEQEDRKVVVRQEGADVCRISVSVKLQGAAAKLVVEEMMIAGNCTAARFGKENLIPMIFVKQGEPHSEDLDKLANVPAGRARLKHALGIFGKTKRSEVYGEHFSLGVEEYVNVTSPIRRAYDLVNHLQLKAFLRGLSPGENQYGFSRAEMRDIIRTLLVRSREIQNAVQFEDWKWVARFVTERQKTHYEETGEDPWYHAVVLVRSEEEKERNLFLQYVRETSTSQLVYTAQEAVRERNRCGLWTVYVKELGIEMDMRLGRDCKVGDTARLAILRVDIAQEVGVAVRLDDTETAHEGTQRNPTGQQSQSPAVSARRVRSPRRPQKRRRSQ